MSQPLLRYFAALGNCLLCWCCVANLAQQLLPALLSHYVQPLVIMRTTASLLWTWIRAGRTFWPASAGPGPAIMCTRGGGIHCQSCPIYALPSLHKICRLESFAIQTGKKKRVMKENKKSGNRLAGLLLTSHTLHWASGHGAPSDISPSTHRAWHIFRIAPASQGDTGGTDKPAAGFFRSDSDHNKINNWPRSSAATLLRFCFITLRLAILSWAV